MPWYQWLCIVLQKVYFYNEWCDLYLLAWQRGAEWNEIHNVAATNEGNVWLLILTCLQRKSKLSLSLFSFFSPPSFVLPALPLCLFASLLFCIEAPYHLSIFLFLSHIEEDRLKTCKLKTNKLKYFMHTIGNGVEVVYIRSYLTWMFILQPWNI